MKSEFKNPLLEKVSENNKDDSKSSQSLGERQKLEFGVSFHEKKWDISDKIAEFYQRSNEKFVDKVDGLHLALILFKNFQQN